MSPKTLARPLIVAALLCQIAPASAGEPAFVAMWEAMGGQERYDRRQAWFDAERPQFLTALLEPR